MSDDEYTELERIAQFLKDTYFTGSPRTMRRHLMTSRIIGYPPKSS